MTMCFFSVRLLWVLADCDQVFGVAETALEHASAAKRASLAAELAVGPLVLDVLLRLDRDLRSKADVFYGFNIDREKAVGVREGGVHGVVVHLDHFLLGFAFLNGIFGAVVSANENHSSVGDHHATWGERFFNKFFFAVFARVRDEFNGRKRNHGMLVRIVLVQFVSEYDLPLMQQPIQVILVLDRTRSQTEKIVGRLP